MATYYAEVGASLFAMTLASNQTLFSLYHYNSYANNPVLLRSPKPMIMRDVFLTKASQRIPNPLSCLYVTRWQDCLANCILCFCVVKPLTDIIGWRHGAALYLGGGFFASFAYLFGTQLNKCKTNTKYDCACTSNGAFASFAALSLTAPKCCIPYSKRTHAAYIGVPYLAKCAYEEYIGPKFLETRAPGTIEVRNWGFAGGVFFAGIYASLFLRTKADLGLVKSFYRNMNLAGRPAAPLKTR